MLVGQKGVLAILAKEGGLKPLPQLQEGERYTIRGEHVKQIMMASKGNVAVACRGFLLILTNVDYNALEEATQQAAQLLHSDLIRATDCILTFRVKKLYPERKFALVECEQFILYTSGSVHEKVVRGENVIFEKEVEGLRVKLANTVTNVNFVTREVTITFENGTFKVAVNAESREYVETREEREVASVTIEKPDAPYALILSRLLKERGRVLIFDREAVIEISVFIPQTPDVRIIRIPPLPSEEGLLKCSSYYTIFVPRLLILSRDRPPLAYINWYRHGVKRELVTRIPSTVARYSFCMLKHRFSLPTTVARRLPTFKAPSINPEWLSASEFAKAATLFVENFAKCVECISKIESERKRPVKVKNLDPLDAFLEAFYSKVPRRKLRSVVQPWFEVFEKVKGLAPRATLYIVSYGKRRRKPNLPGFKVEKDGIISPLSYRYVPVSGIVMKGGDFERLFIEAYVKRLLEYQLAPKERKLAMLLEDVEDARRKVREMGIDPATSKLTEFMDALSKLEAGDNILLITFNHLRTRSTLPRKEEVLTLIAGILKTATEEEVRRILETKQLFNAIRSSVKYEMKKRGYSPRKGVMILGSPLEVKMRVYEVVKRIKGRLLALVEGIGGEVEEALKEISIAAELKRVEALLQF